MTPHDKYEQFLCYQIKILSLIAGVIKHFLNLFTFRRTVFSCVNKINACAYFIVIFVSRSRLGYYFNK